MPPKKFIITNERSLKVLKMAEVMGDFVNVTILTKVCGIKSRNGLLRETLLGTGMCEKRSGKGIGWSKDAEINKDSVRQFTKVFNQTEREKPIEEKPVKRVQECEAVVNPALDAVVDLKGIMLHRLKRIDDEHFATKNALLRIEMKLDNLISELGG